MAAASASAVAVEAAAVVTAGGSHGTAAEDGEDATGFVEVVLLWALPQEVRQRLRKRVFSEEALLQALFLVGRSEDRSIHREVELVDSSVGLRVHNAPIGA